MQAETCPQHAKAFASDDLYTYDSEDTAMSSADEVS